MRRFVIGCLFLAACASGSQEDDAPAQPPKGRVSPPRTPGTAGSAGSTGAIAGAAGSGAAGSGATLAGAGGSAPLCAPSSATPCDTCLTGACCALSLACVHEPTCLACAFGGATAGCESSSVLADLLSCVSGCPGKCDLGGGAGGVAGAGGGSTGGSGATAGKGGAAGAG